jgi:hypothetical protein
VAVHVMQEFAIWLRWPNGCSAPPRGLRLMIPVRQHQRGPNLGIAPQGSARGLDAGMRKCGFFQPKMVSPTHRQANAASISSTATAHSLPPFCAVVFDQVQIGSRYTTAFATFVCRKFPRSIR